MRDILFRGKDTDTGEWVYGSFYPNSDGRTYIIEKMEDLTIYKVATDTVGQYTGLQDKNGNKIYEYDLIKHSDDDCKTGIVVFDKQLALFKVQLPFYSVQLSEYLKNGGIVVGNYFDTPELLKGGNQ